MNDNLILAKPKEAILTHVKNRIIVMVDMDSKNHHTFEDGTKIYLARKYDNFNMRYVNPVNATVISGEGIRGGSQVLIHHNAAANDTNRIFDYKQSSDIGDIRYFSIHVRECYAWYDEDAKSWKPLDGFDFALRIFKPYKGALVMEPELVKNILWITTGRYANTAMQMLKNCDYEMVFQNIDGREGRLIRVRSKENKEEQREEETVFEQKDITKKILNNELLIGLTKNDAKTLKEIQYAR